MSIIHSCYTKFPFWGFARAGGMILSVDNGAGTILGERDGPQRCRCDAGLEGVGVSRTRLLNMQPQLLHSRVLECPGSRGTSCQA
jgi:hypothetical protein